MKVVDFGQIIVVDYFAAIVLKTVDLVVAWFVCYFATLI
jgi:hypothetical protein